MNLVFIADKVDRKNINKIKKRYRLQTDISTIRYALQTTADIGEKNAP